MLFSIQGSYQILINDSVIDPIDQLFPHSFEYKIGEGGEWISAEFDPFNFPNPAISNYATFTIFGDTNPTDDLVYFRIDLNGYGYDYVENNTTGIVQSYVSAGAYDIGFMDFFYTPTCEEQGAVEIWGECYDVDGTTEFSEGPPNDGMEIPTELCDLIYLEEIYLDSMDLVGPIPECFGEIPNLTYLDLSSNELFG